MHVILMLKMKYTCSVVEVIKVKCIYKCTLLETSLFLMLNECK